MTFKLLFTQIHWTKLVVLKILWMLSQAEQCIHSIQKAQAAVTHLTSSKLLVSQISCQHLQTQQCHTQLTLWMSTWICWWFATTWITEFLKTLLSLTPEFVQKQSQLKTFYMIWVYSPSCLLTLKLWVVLLKLLQEHRKELTKWKNNVVNYQKMLKVVITSV